MAGVRDEPGAQAAPRAFRAWRNPPRLGGSLTSQPCEDVPTLPLLGVHQASSGLPCNVSPYQASAMDTRSVPRSRREEALAVATPRAPHGEGYAAPARRSHTPTSSPSVADVARSRSASTPTRTPSRRCKRRRRPAPSLRPDQPASRARASVAPSGQRRVSQRATGRASRAATTAKTMAARMSIG